MLVLVLPKKRLIMMLRAMDAQMMVMMNVAMITTMAAAAGQSDVYPHPLLRGFGARGSLKQLARSSTHKTPIKRSEAHSLTADSSEARD